MVEGRAGRGGDGRRSGGRGFAESVLPGVRGVEYGFRRRESFVDRILVRDDDRLPLGWTLPERVG